MEVPVPHKKGEPRRVPFAVTVCRRNARHPSNGQWWHELQLLLLHEAQPPPFPPPFWLPLTAQTVRCRRPSTLPQLGQCWSRSRSAMTQRSSNLWPQAAQTYSYVGMSVTPMMVFLDVCRSAASVRRVTAPLLPPSAANGAGPRPRLPQARQRRRPPAQAA